MNIIFVGETDKLGLSIYLDPLTAKKKGYSLCPPEGIYCYYYEGKKRGVKAPIDGSYPCVFE